MEKRTGGKWIAKNLVQLRYAMKTFYHYEGTWIKLEDQQLSLLAMVLKTETEKQRKNCSTEFSKKTNDHS